MLRDLLAVEATTLMQYMKDHGLDVPPLAEVSAEQFSLACSRALLPEVRESQRHRMTAMLPHSICSFAGLCGGL